MIICDNKKDNISFECFFHKDFKPQFFSLSSDKNSSEDILHCSKCIDQEKYSKQTFKNYQSIDFLLNSNERTILPKWPPLFNQSLVFEAKSILDDSSNIQFEHQKEQIGQFFESFRREINQHIDQVKKQMLIECEMIPDLKEELFKTYQSIAEIQRIKDILTIPDACYKAVNSKMVEILIEKEKDKQKNEDSLKKVLRSYTSKIERFNSSDPTITMEGINKLIKSINFYPKLPDQQEQIQNESKVNREVNELKKMIENKTNRCTQQFIDEMSQKLEQFSILFESPNSTQIYQEGITEPLNFKDITNDQIFKLEQIYQYMIKSSEEIELTPQVKFLFDLINSPINYLTKEFQEILLNIMKQLAPYFDQIDINSSLIENKCPVKFGLLKETQIDLIDKLVIKMIEKGTYSFFDQVNVNVYPFSSLIKSILQEKKFAYFFQVNYLLFSYPIFEMIKLEEFRFIISDYISSKTDLKLQKLENNNLCFTKVNRHDYYSQITSNQFLQRNKTYKIQFEINYANPSNYGYQIGLENMTSIKSIKEITDLQFNENGISFDKQVNQKKKGQLNNFKTLKSFELQINLEAGILEIADFPLFNDIVQINNNHIAEIQSNNLFQISIKIYSPSDKIIIKNIQIID